MSEKPPLPSAFLTVPIAHRGLHDHSEGRPENSLAAIKAAVEAGFSVEIDVQPSSDGFAMVFHDASLDRMTGETGPVNTRTAADLGRIALSQSQETIPTLRAALDLIAGRVPVLIEMKDQSGALVTCPPIMERAVSDAIYRYDGLVALMAFNPNMVASLARLAPEVPRGLVTEAYNGPEFAAVPPEVLAHLRSGPDLTGIGATFVSHDKEDFDRPWLARYRAKGLPVLCWTIKSAEQEAMARNHADNVTFEGYIPNTPAS